MLFDAAKFDEPRAAAGALMEQAMERGIAESLHLTPDLGGDGMTAKMGDAGAAAL